MATTGDQRAEPVAHTAGPWEAHEDSTNAVSIYAKGGRQLIADVMDLHFDEITEETRANARLIVAASEMLALLQFVMSGIERGKLPDLTILRRNEEEIETQTLSGKIGAVIGKATQSKGSAS